MSPRIKPVAMLPTLCTLGNTFCGFLAIAKVADALLHADAFEQNILFAAWMIMLAMVFDALDGKIARITNQASDFGAQLDSLTDLVTFGVAPAFLTKVIFEHAMTHANLHYQQKFALVISFVYVVCATLRLARFTLETDLDDESHDKFYGLPSPAAAGVVASSVFLLFDAGSPLADLDASVRQQVIRFLPWILPVLGLLMVSRVEYAHVMSRWFRGRKPFVHLVVVLLILFIVATMHEVAFFICFAGYAIAGPLLVIVERTAGRRILRPLGEADPPSPAAPPEVALIAIGSNLGDRDANLRYAVDELARMPETRVIEVSSFHETEPEGGPPQRQFKNAVAKVETSLNPDELLDQLLSIEIRRGRVRTVRNGPRVLDLDIVLYGSTICEARNLTIPHPRFRERTFVLRPAAEVAADQVDPVTGRTIAELLAKVAESELP